MAVQAKADYISMLNQAVSREIQVSLQYMLQHAKMEKLIRKCIPENILLDKTTYDAVGKFLREFAIQEMKHAAAIMERIYYLGGEATTKSDKISVGNSLSEFSKLGVNAEEEALVLYRKIIEAAAKIGDWETREMFEKIYADEEKHLFKFQEYANMQDEKEGKPAVPLSEWRKIFTDDYYALLNKAVQAEISAIVQYTNQHEKASLLALRKKNTTLEVISESNKAEAVSKLLKEIFMVEMDHLEKISERIYLIEGEATFTPDPLPKVGANADEFLKLDHEAENYAIVLYRKIIAEAMKIGDTNTRRMFEDIVMQEEEHYWRFDDYLK
ncbi:MAG TPA: ferritin-like domain-containing protein [Candidatus Bathyarchaeia archaeon]|nr:ferritin-like domain-containing protein [Candidatus Bathyarchaeia archaeon]